MIKRRTAMALIIISIMITSIATYSITNMFNVQVGERTVLSEKDMTTYDDFKGDFDKLLELKDMIIEDYYIPVEEEELYEGMMKGMFEALDDPYSIYMDEHDYQNFIESNSGSYSGIGVVVAPGDNNFITVVSPIEDTPGEAAGLKSGDLIIKVNGEEVFGDLIDEAVTKIKGIPGTDVTLTIRREDADDFDVDITRKVITLKVAKSKMLDDDIGLLRLTMFDNKSAKEFEDHMRQLENAGAKGLIIDLRNNPGGSLDECVDIADMLLGKQDIVYIEDNTGQKEYYKSDASKIEIPYVILVNDGSASASEIVTGAVKDTGSGTIIGTTTFGKGLVQSFRSNGDDTGYKITIAQYFTPNGTYIHEVGIEPDIVIEFDESYYDLEEPTEMDDNQILKAIEVLKEQM